RRERAGRDVRLVRPLGDRATDFAARLRSLSQKRSDQRQRDNFARIKDPGPDLDGFIRWCSGAGTHEAESLFMAATYYRYATWTRDELRNVVASSREKVLLNAIEQAREAHAGEFRIWQSAQDGTGHRMGAPGQATVDEQQFWESVGRREPWL